MKRAKRNPLFLFLILIILAILPSFASAEETPSMAIEKAKFAIEQAQQAGAEEMARVDVAAAKAWLTSAQKQFEEIKSSIGWMSTEKTRKIREEEIIHAATLAKIRAMIAENRAKKEVKSKELQKVLKQLNEQKDMLSSLKKDLTEAEKAQEIQVRIEAEKRPLEEAKRQALAIIEEKKLELAEATKKIRELELLRQKELEEKWWEERQRAGEREKELAEIKFKAKELAKEKAKEEAERKALEEKLAALQEKIAALEKEKAMVMAANKISRVIVNSTGKEIILTILAIDLFTPDMALKTSGKEILNQIGNFLKAYPGFSVTVRGHTDNVGNPALNQVLSEKRAQKVREYLVTYQDLLPTRVIAEGVGPSQPMAPNDTEAGRALNRRVEIIVNIGQ